MDAAHGTSDYNGTASLPAGGLLFTTADVNGNNNTIASGYLTSLTGNIILQAQDNITVNSITTNSLTWLIFASANLIF